jgi:hypothetical protein
MAKARQKSRTTGEHQNMHAIRRSILGRILLGMESMKFGYTFIKRSSTGSVLNADLRPFASFDECCIAAEKAAQGESAPLLETTHVVYCHYDERHCIPEMRPILRIYDQQQTFAHHQCTL